MATDQLEARPEVKDLYIRLRLISIFADLEEDQLRWLASEMTELIFEPGEAMVRAGEAADRLTVILEGEMFGETDSGDRTFRAYAGQVTGLLPYSRLKIFPMTARAVVPTRVAALPKSKFDEMLRRIPQLNARLVAVLADRIRETAAREQQREKLAALGKLSAGLAHELNNPAAAARRAADSLGEAVEAFQDANLELTCQDLTTEQRRYLARMECTWGERVSSVVLDSVERSDREERIGGWLDKKGVENAWILAPDLVEAGCELPALIEVAEHFPPASLSDVFKRLSASFSMTRLAREVQSSTLRISELVRAIKQYTYMDQMPEQEIDIHEGIENTLIMLKHDLKQGVSVVRQYDRSVPKVCARGGELNQVWTNLIDNAIAAMKGKGELTIRTYRTLNRVVVEIRDSGPGIPAEIQDHIFEPFFTTKQVGEGTGLGLDTVYRIVRAHRGEVRVESKPGDTCFLVSLPAAREEEEK